MSARWYYAKGKQRVGPVTFADLQRLTAAGEIQPADMVLQEGTPKWVAASSVDQLWPAEPSAKKGGLSAFARRLLAQAGRIASETWQQTVRLGAYVKDRWTGRVLKRSLLDARRALGRRVSEVGGGDGSLRSQLAALDQEIRQAEAARGATRRLQAKRQELFLKLADQALTRPSPPSGAEAEFTEVRKAEAALREHETSMSASRQKLFSRGAAGWARVGVGYGVVGCVLVLIAVAVQSGPGSTQIETAGAAHSDDRLAAAGKAGDPQAEGIEKKPPPPPDKPQKETDPTPKPKPPSGRAETKPFQPEHTPGEEASRERVARAKPNPKEEPGQAKPDPPKNVVVVSGVELPLIPGYDFQPGRNEMATATEQMSASGGRYITLEITNQRSKEPRRYLIDLFPNGKPFSIEVFKNNFPAEAKSWWSNGRQSSSTSYSGFSKSGIWEFWNREGVVIGKVEYRLGRPSVLVWKRGEMEQLVRINNYYADLVGAVLESVRARE